VPDMSAISEIVAHPLNFKSARRAERTGFCIDRKCALPKPFTSEIVNNCEHARNSPMQRQRQKKRIKRRFSQPLAPQTLTRRGSCATLTKIERNLESEAKERALSAKQTPSRRGCRAASDLGRSKYGADGCRSTGCNCGDRQLASVRLLAPAYGGIDKISREV
jgi:hypothetical protein